MNWAKLAFHSIALSLAMAGIAMIIGKSLINKRFSVASFLYLTTLIAVALVVFLASLHT
jgi:hypothetical protein